MRLEEYLSQASLDQGLVDTLLALSDSVLEISDAILESDDEKAGTENTSGEDQLKLDVISNDIVKEVLIDVDAVGLVASEEMEDEENIGEGEYAVIHDPLDGSSLLDVNLAVGSIFGVYKTKTFIGVTGREQKAAMLGVYGPRTAIFLTVGNGTHYFVLNGEGDFVLHRENVQVSEGKMFAPGNLRAAKSRSDYAELVNYWMMEQYTLRYSGGMVPDVGQILLKGKGIFSYPGYEDAPNGKLRLLYECAPMAFLMEEAGGAASNGKIPILDVEATELAQRTPIFIGSKDEVKRCEDTLA